MIKSLSLPLLMCMLLMAGCATSSGNFSEKQSGKEAADTQVRLAVGYMENDKYELALERLLRATKFDPKSSEAFTTLGVLYERIGNKTEAEKSYRRAADLEPKKGAPHNNYGQFLCSVGKYDQAEKEFAIALADPFYKTPALAAGNAGMCAKAAGKSAVAESYLRKALNIDPSLSQLYLPLAMVLESKGEAMKARAFLQRHETSGIPASADFLAFAVRVETRLGDQRSASNYLVQLGEKFPASEEAKRLGVGNDSDAPTSEQTP